jgi:hypothetical protein
MQRVEHLLGERVIDILGVLVPNGTVLAAVNLLQLNQLLSMLSILTTVAYTIWRWRRDRDVNCEACRDGRVPRICPVQPLKRPWYCPKNL